MSAAEEDLELPVLQILQIDPVGVVQRTELQLAGVLAGALVVEKLARQLVLALAFHAQH